ncbi:hypothetical protein JXA32_16595 [Candidatus Sumerlaeota bacterium]|nr:hypothetical protein [Candidatus Sumerlaeota bacterium]
MVKCRNAQTLQGIFIGLIFLALTGCSKEISYKQAATTHPYIDLSEDDRRWLFQHHSTRSGAFNWVDDEIRLYDENIQVWFTSDKTMELEDTRSHKKYNIDLNTVHKMVKQLGGRLAAEKIVDQARAKIGDTTIHPQEPMVPIALSDDCARAQKLRYPKIWEKQIIIQSQILVNEAKQLQEQGMPLSAAPLMDKAIKIRKSNLGEDHKATVGALSMFEPIVGMPYSAYNPENIEQLSKAEQYTMIALKMLQAGRRDQAFEYAKQAYMIKKNILGAEDPTVKRMEADIINAFQRNP